MEQNGQNPNAQYPNAQYPNAQYPNAQYPNAQYPNAQYPNAQYPNAQYPNAQNPNAQYPNAQYPNAQYPNAQYPNAQYPNAQYPNAQYPNAQYPNAYNSSVEEEEETKNGNILTKIIGTLIAIAIIFMAVTTMEDGLMSTVMLIIAGIIISPIPRMIFKKKSKIFSVVRAVGFVAALVIGFGTSTGESANTLPQLTVEQAYQQLVTEATEGDYQAGHSVYVNYPDLANYMDAVKYNDYCDAMCAYKAGGIGYAYQKLLAIPEILNAQIHINTIKSELSFLNGVFKADNKMGSYLYIVFENGSVLMDTVGYTQATGNFTYNMSESYNTIVKGKFTDGSTYYAIGSYKKYGNSIETDYVIYPYEADNEIMVLAFEGNEFKTFNGNYTKIR